MAAPRKLPPADDAGNTISGWLIKVSLLLIVLGIVAFDAISLGQTRLQLADHANHAAQMASDNYRTSRDPQAALGAALKAAHQDNEHNEIEPGSFVVEDNARVTLKMTRTASTLVVKHIPPLRKYATATAEGAGRQP